MRAAGVEWSPATGGKTRRRLEWSVVRRIVVFARTKKYLEIVRVP